MTATSVVTATFDYATTALLHARITGDAHNEPTISPTASGIRDEIAASPIRATLWPNSGRDPHTPTLLFTPTEISHIRQLDLDIALPSAEQRTKKRS